MKQVIAASAFLLVLCTSNAALALAQRTFVASNGSDTWSCSRAQPCRSFATAIANTAAKGEVIALDSAGYGPVTIAQSVSIVAPPGVYAGITVTSGTGITIDGAGIAVALRGLTINGQGGFYGIEFNQGALLTIEGCEIANIANSGMVLKANDSRVVIRDTVIRNNGFAGINGFQSSGETRISISGSTIANNQTGVIAKADAGAMTVSVARSTLTGDGTAMSVTALAGAASSILSDGNTITYSVTVFDMGGAGVAAIYTANNNTIGYYSVLTNGGSLTPCCGV